MKNRFMRSLISTLACLAILALPVSAAFAEGEMLNLIFIGGDADREEGANNICRNLLEHHEDLREQVETFFVRSTMNDYTNTTAMKHAEEVKDHLSPDRTNIVCAYSHGGQTAFFLETELVRDLYIFDACVAVQGKGDGADAKGRYWAEWFIETAKKGVNLHIFASKGKHDEYTGTKNAIKNLAQYPETDDCVVSTGEGLYRILDRSGNEIARIETAVLDGTHKDICIRIEDRLAEDIYAMLKEQGKQ